jgi:hypothetical protein
MSPFEQFLWCVMALGLCYVGCLVVLSDDGEA